MTSRRQFIKMGIVTGVGTALPIFTWRAFASTQIPQTPLLGANIPQFVEPLPTFVGKRVTATSFNASMLEFQQHVLPRSIYTHLPAPFNQGTYLWGYKIDSKPASYPGYTVEAQKGTPTTITYINNLPLPATGKLEKLLTADQTIHWADPLNQMGSTDPYKGPIPVVTHLHGAEVPSSFDGGPEQWFTTNGIHGKTYGTFAPTSPNAAVYRYPNTQPATALWFHDHALGLTRINVFAGLANFYLLRDQYDTGLPTNPLKLPAGSQEIELMIQDRQFDTNGQLLFPDGTPDSNPTGLNGPPPNPSVHPYWIPEFFGDAIIVNGKTWPYLDVEPRRYRFRVLNASNARFYQISLVDSSNQSPGPALWQIGTDGGLLDRPVMLDSSSGLSLFAPSERADVIVDFSGHAGRNFTLINTAPAPFPGGDAPDPTTNGRIMQFRVRLPLSSQDTTYNPARGAPLRGGSNEEPAIVRLVNPQAGTLAASVKPAVKRQLVLVEVEGPGGPIEVLVNNTKWDGLRDGTTTPVPGSQPDQVEPSVHLTELPHVGATEEWEIINLTEDAHPIHIHLIQFQLMNRQSFDVDSYRAKYDSLFPGGLYPGLMPNGDWGQVEYPKGVYIPGYGPPQNYSAHNHAGAVGGNPDVTPYLQGNPLPPDANEAGWKDTLKMFPEQVTRIVIRWAPTSVPVNGVTSGQNLFSFDPTVGPGYVWHCHILDHEDNEMMRPYAPIK